MAEVIMGVDAAKGADTNIPMLKTIDAKKLFKPPTAAHDFVWHDDVERIIQVARDNGYRLFLPDAKAVWEIVSAKRDAVWSNLPESDAEVWAAIAPVVKKAAD